MVKTHKITQAQADAANAAPLPTQVYYPEPSLRSYYIDALIGSLLQPESTEPDGSCERARQDGDPPRHRIYRGGLRIYTNYDPTMQYIAEPRDQQRHPEEPGSVHGRARVDRQLQRGGARGRLRPGLRREPVRSRRRRSRTAGGVVVQGHHARDSALQRVLARRPGRRLRPALAASARATGATRTTTSPATVTAATPTLTAGDRDLRQLRVRAHRAVARPR